MVQTVSRQALNVDSRVRSEDTPWFCGGQSVTGIVLFLVLELLHQCFTPIKLSIFHAV